MRKFVCVCMGEYFQLLNTVLSQLIKSQLNTTQVQSSAFKAIT